MTVELRLDGQVALVTGASRGIGRSIAAAFVEAGAKVMLSSRKREDLEKAAAAIGGEVDVCAAHAGDEHLSGVRGHRESSDDHSRQQDAFR